MARIEIKAEITGKVWQIATPVGSSVAAEDPIVILEAMKMEIPVAATSAGKVAEIRFGEGDTVNEGDVVAILES
ncbi:MAG: biotin/lipoyl-binding carrier protein [Reyranellaceae bacterium]